MLREAIEAKKRELRGIGVRYSQRELARESGVTHTYVTLVLKGKRRPTPEVLRAWAAALDPYLPLDEALMAAEHMPDDPALRAVVQRLARFPKDVRQKWAAVADFTGNLDDEMLEDLFGLKGHLGGRRDSE